MSEIDRIHVEEAGLLQLKEALLTAGEEYKSNLSRLTNLIQQITQGDIRGDLAEDFKKKYEAKQETFKKLETSINEAESYMGVKREGLETTIANTSSDMK